MKIVADIEADGYLEDATQIWCFVAKELNVGRVFEFTYKEIDKLKAFLSNVKVLIGHNFYGYDLPLLKKLYNIDWGVDSLMGSSCKIVDTYNLSMRLDPDRGLHGLDAWGERVGIPKPKIDNWKDLSLEAYLHRCREDVEINYRMYYILLDELKRYRSLYEDSKTRV